MSVMAGRPEERSPGPAAQGIVKVPGACLFYKVHGCGPWLMLLGGGASDADGAGPVVSCLAAHYTVITYDRRGLSRSLLDDLGKPPAITVATHSEDAHRLLTALGACPAMIFGSSIGAVIGLDLLIRHRQDVRLLVAHEPPIGSLLTAAEESSVSFAEIYARTGDADAAISQFAASLTSKGPGLRTPERPRTAPKTRNNEFFITNDAPAVRRYELDIDGLKALTSRLVVGGGRDGRDFNPYLCASRLAERLGITLTEFPGSHGGYGTHPAEFARSLHHVLSADPAAP